MQTSLIASLYCKRHCNPSLVNKYFRKVNDSIPSFRFQNKSKMFMYPLAEYYFMNECCSIKTVSLKVTAGRGRYGEILTCRRRPLWGLEGNLIFLTMPPRPVVLTVWSASAP